MSVDEDSELRELVSQTLETNGVLGKIRAELRASVFMALEEQDPVKNKAPFVNQELKNFLLTTEGLLVISLVREFLQFFKLDYTLVVFDPESGFNGQYITRPGLMKQLNISESLVDSNLPLISEVLRRFHSSVPSLESLSVEQISEARRKFNEYDRDKSGRIEKNELQLLFADVFPGVNRNMLDRYVNDEFRVTDKDFSNAIEFGEFLSMYRRVFVLCKSVASKNNAEAIVPSKVGDDNKDFNEVKEKASESTNGLKWNADSKFIPDLVKKSDENSCSSSQEELPLPHYKPDGFSSSVGILDFGSKAANDTRKAAGSGMSSLADLPDLGFTIRDRERENAKNDLEVIDLGVNFGDYDDDFQESNISPIGPTPRSARSENNAQGTFDEVVEEEEEEEIEEELLASVASSIDDLTTDKTISVAAEAVGSGDYFEDIVH